MSEYWVVDISKEPPTVLKVFDDADHDGKARDAAYGWKDGAVETFCADATVYQVLDDQ